MEKTIITFSANEQRLIKTGGIECYASNIVSYIEAHFDLGANWSGYDSVRAVWSNDNNMTVISTVLDSNGVCVVPFEVLKTKGIVKVNLVGSISVSDVLTDRLTTFPCEAVKVTAKAKTDGSETQPITPSQFEQYVAIVQALVGSVRDIDHIVLNDDYTLTIYYSDGTSDTTSSIRGATGNGIASVAKTGTSGLVDTYTITFTNGTTTAFTVTNGAKGDKGDKGDTGDTGNGIASIELTSTVGAVKTYTITFTDGTSYDYEVTDGEVTNASMKAYVDPQFTDLKSEINHIDDDSFYYASMPVDVTANGYRLNQSDGFCTANASYKMVKYKVTAGDIIKVKSDDRFQFQTVASVPTSGTSNRVGVTHQTGEGLFIVPTGATYLIVSTPTTDSVADAYLVFSKQDLIDDNLNSVANLNLFTLESATFGYALDSSGTQVSGVTSAYTDYIPVNPETDYLFSGIFDTTAPVSSMNFRIHEYSSSKVWIKQGTYINVPKGVDTGAFRSATFKTSSTTAYIRISLGIAHAIENPVFVNQTNGGITSIDRVARAINDLQNEHIKSQVEFNCNGLYKLYGYTWEQGGIGSSTGADFSSINAIRTDYIDLLGASIFQFSFAPAQASTEFKVFYYDSNKAFIKYDISTKTEVATYKMPSNAKYVRFHMANYGITFTTAYSTWLIYAGVMYDNADNGVPSYYKSHLETKEATIRGHEAACSFNGDALLFLTDTHYSADYIINDNFSSNQYNTNHSIPMVLDILKNTGVRFVSFGGDLINSANSIDEMMQAIHVFNSKFDNNKYRLVSMAGNHEYYTDLNDEDAGRPTANELYGGYAKVNEDIILGKGSDCTYYFDNPAQKIRYFMISCGRDTELTVEQVEWVLESFTHIPDGYRLIVFGHAFLNPTLTAFRDYHLNIAEAMDAITAGTSYTFNGNSYNYATLNNVEVVCIITGHTHVDGYLQSVGGTLCICTTCDSYGQNAQISGGSQVTVPRTKNTVDEQAFDVYQFDFDSKKIYCTRIGYGSDREFTY